MYKKILKMINKVYGNITQFVIECYFLEFQISPFQIVAVNIAVMSLKILHHKPVIGF